MKSVRPIDLVYCFVDGSDPIHLAAREKYWTIERNRQADLVTKVGYFEQVGEIRYSVRSALQSMPWIRRVLVVTDGQSVPVDEDLLKKGRVKLVDHKDFIPAEFRPVFSPPIIESFLHRIPELSEVWLYHNDDFFVGAPLEIEDFVSTTGQLVVRSYASLIRHVLRCGCECGLSPHGYCNPYTFGVSNSARLLSLQLNIPLHMARTPRHFTQIYRRETGYRLEECLSDALMNFRRQRFRSFSQLSFSTLVTSLEKRLHGLSRPPLRKVRTTSFFDFDDARSNYARRQLWKKVRDCEAHFFCLNNIPTSERRNFEEVMEARGFGKPLK